MSVMIVVFDPMVAPKSGDLSAWLQERRSSGRGTDPMSFTSPETSSELLRGWFRDMAKKYPRAEDADPDDLRGTEYSFFKDHIEVVFAGPVAEDGVKGAIQSAKQHGLGILDDKRKLHQP
jgi:hypothetical protein